ncbi:MAG: PAS domain-containing protein [Alphaproteobacteria bacterium]|nr:PAS domain-containing protein [Alphaproteobacteria bacterium]
MDLDITHPELAALREYWEEKRGGQQMPARADIDPLDMKRWLGHLALLDVIDGGRDFVFRVHGVHLVDLYGVDITGRALSQADSVIEAVVADEYRKVVDDKARHRILCAETDSAIRIGRRGGDPAHDPPV